LIINQKKDWSNKQSDYAYTKCMCDLSISNLDLKISKTTIEKLYQEGYFTIGDLINKPSNDYNLEILIDDLFFAIIDEVDSILVDEARTPLIIAGKSQQPKNMIYCISLLPTLIVFSVKSNSSKKFGD